jgi:DNA polymerase/3'-5' exonuclease PolX
MYLQKMYEQIQEINGVGPVLAKELCDKIKKNVKDPVPDKIRYYLSADELFQTLPILSKIDIMYNPIKRIPRDIIHFVNDELNKYLRGIKFNIAGSYRRKKLVSRDIDLVVIGDATIVKKIRKLINEHSQMLYIYPPYAGGSDKISVLFEILVPIELQHLPLLKDKLTTAKKARIKVDIFICTKEDHMYTLLFATGSGDFNVRMRSVAKSRGLLLNQHGLFDRSTGKKIEIKNEEEIFEYLKIEYKTPEQRV